MNDYWRGWATGTIALILALGIIDACDASAQTLPVTVCTVHFRAEYLAAAAATLDIPVEQFDATLDVLSTDPPTISPGFWNGWMTITGPVMTQSWSPDAVWHVSCRAL